MGSHSSIERGAGLPPRRFNQTTARYREDGAAEPRRSARSRRVWEAIAPAARRPARIPLRTRSTEMDGRAPIAWRTRVRQANPAQRASVAGATARIVDSPQTRTEQRPCRSTHVRPDGLLTPGSDAERSVRTGRSTASTARQRGIAIAGVMGRAADRVGLLDGRMALRANTQHASADEGRADQQPGKREREVSGATDPTHAAILHMAAHAAQSHFAPIRNDLGRESTSGAAVGWTP